MERQNLSIYEQIYRKYRKLIENSVYKVGDSLPSVRAEALSNSVNPNTVFRAYQQLEREGLIITIPKKGFYVAAKGEKDRFMYLRQELLRLTQEGFTFEEIRKEIEKIGKESEDACGKEHS